MTEVHPVDAGDQRRDEDDLLFRHRRQDLRRLAAHLAVLERVDACLDGELDPGQPLGMGGDAVPQSVRLVDVMLDLRKGKPSIELNPSTGSTRGASAGIPADPNMIVVGVWMLEPGEDLIVARRLHEVLSKAGRA